MSKRTGILSLFLLIAAGILSAVLWWSFRPDAELALTANEAEKLVLEQYEGEIVHTMPIRNGIQLQLQSPQGLYQLEVDGSGDGIVSIELLEAYPAEPALPEEGQEPGAGEQDPQPPTGQPPVLLTEQEAVAVSLKQVDGKVEDIEFRSNESSRYYLVEIEAPDGKEAVIQVNAISGAIMSVVWDEDDD